MLTLGTHDATFDWSTDQAAIMAACGLPAEFFNPGIDGATPQFVVTDVSGETGSLYDRKMTVAFDGSTTVDYVAYFRSDSTVTRIGGHELITGGGGKSSTLVELDVATGDMRGEYLAGEGATHAQTDEGIRFFSANGVSYWYAFLAKSPESQFHVYFTHDQNNAVETNISVSTIDAVDGTYDVTNATACVSLPAMSVLADNTLNGCVIAGAPILNSSSFITGTLYQIPLSYYDNATSSRGIAFPQLFQMSTRAPNP